MIRSKCAHFNVRKRDHTRWLTSSLRGYRQGCCYLTMAMMLLCANETSNRKSRKNGLKIAKILDGAHDMLQTNRSKTTDDVQS